jgi:hypothetical protein
MRAEIYSGVYRLLQAAATFAEVRLVEKPEGKRRHRRRWEDTIKMDLKEIGCGLDLAQNMSQWRAPVETAKNVRFP